MNDEDFYHYYEEPLKKLRYEGDWEVHALFPEEASITQEDKDKALNALYRFIVADLIEFFPPKDPMNMLQFLADAALEPFAERLPESYIETWVGTLVCGTYMLSELGFPENCDEKIPPDFRSNLEALFKKHDVGFERGNVYD